MLQVRGTLYFNVEAEACSNLWASEDLIESIKADQCVNFEANYATLRLS